MFFEGYQKHMLHKTEKEKKFSTIPLTLLKCNCGGAIYIQKAELFVHSTYVFSISYVRKKKKIKNLFYLSKIFFKMLI